MLAIFLSITAAILGFIGTLLGVCFLIGLGIFVINIIYIILLLFTIAVLFTFILIIALLSKGLIKIKSWITSLKSYFY